LWRDRLLIPDVNKKMTSFRGAGKLGQFDVTWGKLTTLASHLTKKVKMVE
jgi:hypothetical protein